jgi:predicted dehydrogenase
MEVLQDESVNAVLIATRHHLHARYTIEALRRGKCVFVEKPLVMTREDLTEVAKAIEETGGKLQVGFNRRFAPTAKAAREFMARVPRQTMLYRINAGPLPSGHWLRDPAQGGGRLVGEGCHFIDFLHFLCSSRPERVHARALGGDAADAGDSFTLETHERRLDRLHPLHRDRDSAFPKERVETSAAAAWLIDDFKTGTLVGNGRSKKIGGSGQDKGQAAQMDAFVRMVVEGTAPIGSFSGAATAGRLDRANRREVTSR